MVKINETTKPPVSTGDVNNDDLFLIFDSSTMTPEGFPTVRTIKYSELIKLGNIITSIGGWSGTLSDTNIPSEKLVKEYIDTTVAGMGAFVGDLDASLGDIPVSGSGELGAIMKGDYWRISTAGQIVGITPVDYLEIGDIIVSKENDPTVGSGFFALQANLHPIEDNTSQILIEFPEDTPTPPEPAELYENGNKSVRIRKFAGDTNNSVTFDWATPWDMDTTKPIQYRVKGIITEATPPSNEEVVFQFSGYGAGDGSDSSSAFGTPVQLIKTFTTSHATNDVFITPWSGDVVIPNIDRDTINQFLFERLIDVGGITDYAQKLGVIEIEIKYTKR